VKVLIADHDATSRYTLSGLVRKCGHEVVLAGNGSEALASLQSSQAPSVAILNCVMPEMSGIEVCKALRAIPDRHYTYLISLSPKNEKQDLIEALEAGFDDFLSLPVELRELNARLMVGRRIIELQEKLLLTCDAMKFEASHDALTGVWNRAGIIELLQAQVARSQRTHTSLALLMIDFDNFKTINDSYGHRAGDQALKHFARVMTSSIRTYDWLGRYGGDEFVLIAPDCSREQASVLARRLADAIAGKPAMVEDHPVTATVSVGISTTQDSGADVNALLDVADAAAYLAKQEGRNRVVVGTNSTGNQLDVSHAVNPQEAAPAGGFRGVKTSETKPPARGSAGGMLLPPFSTVATRALQLVSKETPLRQLADLISTDPAFSSEVLTLINSPLYSLRNPINSIQQAVALLGLELIRGLVVTVGVRAYFGSALKNPALQGCWRHSLACAIIADELAESSLLDRGIAYTGGIMHDIGRVALAVAQPDRYGSFLKEDQENSVAALVREREWFEVDHCEMGRCLVHEWNLPDEFLDITSRHHIQETQGTFDRLALVASACMIADSIGFAAVRLSKPGNYQEIISALPERTRSHFPADANEMGSRIDAKIRSIVSSS
jgi:diguanylate cyclase (GGDEF)-like protein/putative nucleotidyltransferase with HDIG domain